MGFQSPHVCQHLLFDCRGELEDWTKLKIVSENVFTADQILAGTKDMVVFYNSFV